MALILPKVPFWMTIDLRFRNPNSERIWWVKHLNFDNFDFFARFLGQHFRCRSLCLKTIFFMAFFLLKVPFWMKIVLWFLNPNSERIWWVKHLNFDHFDFFARFSVYTSVVDPYAQKPFFYDLIYSKGSILIDNLFKILNSEFWTYLMG